MADWDRYEMALKRQDEILMAMRANRISEHAREQEMELYALGAYIAAYNMQNDWGDRKPARAVLAGPTQ